MKLIKAKISGYRRLADNCEVRLDTDPVCIVGPNAAGKSSFLTALESLNTERDFHPNERTRVPQGAPLGPTVEARLVLEGVEKDLISGISEAGEVTQFLIRKHEDGSVSHLAHPRPQRNPEKRKAVAAMLEELAKSNWLAGAAQVELQLDPAPERSIKDLLEEALRVASSEKDSLGSEAELLVAFRERLVTVQNEQREEAAAKEALEQDQEAEDSQVFRDWPPLPKKYETLEALLHSLIEYEQSTHPHVRTVRLLADRIPEFVSFTSAARELRSVYDLGTEEPPADGAAIHNFLALADTTWSEMLGFMQGGDPGQTEAYEEGVNALLKERAALVWEASDLRVRVRMDGTTLTILLSMQANDYITFDQHSDGLRQFIALRAFLAREGHNTPPIILIDEAETHLHYDAQADLVSVFEEQDDAAKIIYTTHSAGCLPRDLGLGIRAIVPEVVVNGKGEEVPGDHSRVINKFWTEGRGYSPLLIAMGAGALAFSATQKAVVTEGMSDALLLPTLVREATGKDRLAYQAAPSFAEASSGQIRDFDLIAARIAFLADGDEGGRAHVKRLTSSGILDDQVRFLGAEDSGLTIEDLLVPAVYLQAVNAELGTWHQLEFPAARLPEKGRSKEVEKWCEEKGNELGKEIKVSKVDIVQRVLDQRMSTALLDEQHQPLLVALDAEFDSIFDAAPERIQRLKDALKEVEEQQGPALTGQPPST